MAKNTKTTKTKSNKSISKTKKSSKKAAPKKATRKEAAPKNVAKMAETESPEHHSMLKEALKDIASELTQLREEKMELEATLDDVAGNIADTQNKEITLKDQLRKLDSVENALNLKRTRLRKNLEQIKGKIQKVRQLSSKMESL